MEPVTFSGTLNLPDTANKGIDGQGIPIRIRMDSGAALAEDVKGGARIVLRR